MQPAPSPIWATPGFRLFILLIVFTFAAIAVVIFEIVPLFESRMFDPVHEAPAPLDPQLVARLATAPDGAPLETQDKAYDALIEHLLTESDDSLAARAREVNPREFTTHPASVRGRCVRLQAVFATWQPIALDHQVASVEFVYRAFLVDTHRDIAYVIDLLEAPQSFERRESVTVDAVFVRTATYEAKHSLEKPGTSEMEEEPQILHAPLFVGRRLVAFDESHATGMLDAGTLGMVGAVLIAVTALYCAVLLRQHMGRERRQREQLERALNAGKSTPAGAEGASPGAAAPARRGGPPPLEAGSARTRALPGSRAGIPAQPRTGARARASRSSHLVGWIVFGSLAIGGVAVVHSLWRAGWFGTKSGGEVDIAPVSTPEIAWQEANVARAAIATIEEKLFAEGSVLAEADAESLELHLETLEESHETIHSHIEEMPKALALGKDPIVVGWRTSLMQIRLWILDGVDVLDQQPSPAGAPGYYIVLHRVLGKSEAARAELEASDKSGAGAAPSAELRERLVDAREALTNLHYYVEMGLSREHLTSEVVLDLAPLEQELQRLDAILGKYPAR